MQTPASAEDNASSAALYDLAALGRLAGQIAQLSAAGEPQSQAVTSPIKAAQATPLLLLPGAFNPPTLAHLALAGESLRAVPGARCFFSLGTTIINKEQTERASLLDRLLLLEQITRRIGNLGVLLTNQGLYVQQAAAARAAFPQVTDLYFVVGFDKIEQIFDARYYADRDAALRELFSLAGLLVAPRASHEAADLAALLNRPENRAFQDAIRLIPLPSDYQNIASSQIRAALQTQPANLAAASLTHLLPPEALTFALETGCYSPAVPLPSGEMLDRYAIRAALIARVLALPPAAQSSINLRQLFVQAISDSEAGQKLRRWLALPAGTPLS